MSAVLLGMGNPLLDISAKVDKDVLEKYGVRIFQRSTVAAIIWATASSRPRMAYSSRTATKFWQKRSTCRCTRCAHADPEVRGLRAALVNARMLCQALQHGSSAPSIAAETYAWQCCEQFRREYFLTHLAKAGLACHCFQGSATSAT